MELGAKGYVSWYHSPPQSQYLSWEPAMPDIVVLSGNIQLTLSEEHPNSRVSLPDGTRRTVIIPDDAALTLVSRRLFYLILAEIPAIYLPFF